jgi:asparagine synthase (glutamine-hydrolysing)
MRIGVVIGLPPGSAGALADRLACGTSDIVAAVRFAGTRGVVLAARTPADGAWEAGPGRTVLHDGGLPGEPIPAVGALPDCGVVVHAEGGRVVVARDPIGVRPFHFGRAGAGVVLGSSQIAGLAARPEVNRIEAVPPGHIAVLGPDSVEIRPGSTPEPPDPPPGPDGGWLTGAPAALRAALADAVARRVPPGGCPVLLSGGVDSATVLALARAVSPRVRAVTVAAPGSVDLDYARRLTGDLGVPLELVEAPTEEQMLDQLDEMIARLETWESQVLTHAFPTWAALSALCGRTSVVLTGDGSDELLGGYRDGADSPAEILGGRLRELGNLHRTSCQRLDRLGAAAGIDVRLPFLAPNVVRTALALPARALVGDGLSKLALRVAMRDDLPGYVLARPKLTFARGVGFRYGSQAEGSGLLAAGFRRESPVPPERRAEVDRLSSGAFERYTLARFLKHRYDRAAYMLSRTL